MTASSTEIVPIAARAEIVLIAARADNGVIGHDGGLPWHLPADLRRFKAMTTGLPMVMGRRTFEGAQMPLPGRRHIVLTRDRGWRAAGAEPVASLDEAVALAAAPVVAVIGGAEVFALALPAAHRFELTEIHLSPDGDTAMPYPAGFREAAREDHPADGGRPGYSFVTLVR